MIIGWRWRDVNEYDYDVMGNAINLKTEQWSNKLMDLRSLVGWIHLNCTQAKVIVERFPVNAVDGSSPIENAIIVLISRIVDLDNIDILISTLPVENKASLFSKVGIFNLLNFQKIDKIGIIDLNLKVAENRKLLVIIIELIRSNTIKLDGATFRVSNRNPLIKNWTLPDSWGTSKGNKDNIPEEGILTTSFKIFDGNDPNVQSRLKKCNKKNCLVSVPRVDNDHNLLDVENCYDNYI